MTDLFQSDESAWMKFAQEGDSYEGQVISVNQRQANIFGTQQPDFFPDGRPKMELVLTLDIDGVETKTSMKPRSKMAGAIAKAVRDAGVTQDHLIGGHLKLTYTGYGQPSKPGQGAPKTYAAEFQPGNGPAVPLAEAAPAPAVAQGNPIHQSMATENLGYVPQNPVAPAPANAGLPAGF